MGVPLLATMAYPYAGRSLSKGDRFEASEKDAKLLKMLNRAVDATALSQPRAVLTRALKADADEPRDESAEPRPKRQYRRRDLVPEP